MYCKILLVIFYLSCSILNYLYKDLFIYDKGKFHLTNVYILKICSIYRIFAKTSYDHFFSFLIQFTESCFLIQYSCWISISLPLLAIDFFEFCTVLFRLAVLVSCMNVIRVAQMQNTSDTYVE